MMSATRIRINEPSDSLYAAILLIDNKWHPYKYLLN